VPELLARGRDEIAGVASTASGRGGVLPHFERRGPLWASPPILNAFDANTQTGVTLMRFDGVLAFIERFGRNLL
jgi:hypothetical protein